MLLEKTSNSIPSIVFAVKEEVEWQAPRETLPGKVTHVSKLTFRLQNVEEKLGRLGNNHGLEPLLKEANWLHAKIPKVKKIREEVLKQLQVDTEYSPVCLVTSKGLRFYLIVRVEGNESGIAVVSKKFSSKLATPIGSGSFAQVFAHSNENVNAIAKWPRSFEDLRMQLVAHKQIRKEAEVLSILHMQGTIPGIISPPKAIIESAFGPILIALRFDRNLAEWKSQKGVAPIYDDGLETVLRGFFNLFGALKHIHERGFCHGDIKPENIACYVESRNDPFRLADFGGAVKLDQTKEPLQTGTYTQKYFPLELYEALERLKEQPLILETQQKFREYGVKRDWFALAKSLVEILNEEECDFFFYLDPAFSNHPSTEVQLGSMEWQLKTSGYCPQLIDLLRDIFQACGKEGSGITPDMEEDWVRRIASIPSPVF